MDTDGHGLKQRELSAFAFGFDEHLAEDVIKHVHDDGVAGEFVLRRVTNPRRLYFVDVRIVYTHKAETLAGREFTDAELFAL